MARSHTILGVQEARHFLRPHSVSPDLDGEHLLGCYKLLVIMYGEADHACGIRASECRVGVCVRKPLCSQNSGETWPKTAFNEARHARRTAVMPQACEREHM
jgi:hypothetical protein